MFRLYDAQARRVQPVTPARRGELRMHTCGLSVRHHADIGDVRGYLLPDLIRRAAELGGLHVTVCHNVSDSGTPAVTDRGDEGSFAADLAELNIRPAEHLPRAPESTTPIVIDIHVSPMGQICEHSERQQGQANAVAGHEVVQLWVHGEHVLFDGHTQDHTQGRTQSRTMAKSAGHSVVLTDLATRGLDPLALRLALLDCHYREQARLTWDIIESAGKTLRRWREQVAAWACEPSAAMSRPHLMAALSAFAEDLDTPAALRELRELETDATVVPGAKFETFLHLDRLLGLDIAREVGKPGIARHAAGGESPPGRR